MQPPFNLTWHDILAQALGFVAFAIFMYAYQVKDPRKSELLFAPGNFFYGLQYIMLMGGLTSSSAIMFASSTRSFAAAYMSDKALKIISALYLVFVWTITLLLYKSAGELMIAASATLSTAASVSRDHFYRYRGFLLGRQTCMLFFNSWIGSFAGMIHLCFTLVSNCVGIYRHHKASLAESS